MNLGLRQEKVSIKSVRTESLGEVRFLSSKFSLFGRNREFFEVIDNAFAQVSTHNASLLGLDSLKTSSSNLFFEHAYFYLTLIRRNIRRFLTERSSLFEAPLKFGLLYDNTTVAAALAMRSGRQTWIIETLGVKSQYREKGLGKLLLVHVINYLKDRKANSIVISVNATNTPALRLYESLGFKEQEARIFLKLSTAEWQNGN